MSTRGASGLADGHSCSRSAPPPRPFLTLDEAFAARGNAQQQPRLLDFLFDSVASLWASGSPTMASCRNRGGALRRHPGRADARNRHLRGSLPRSDSSML